MVIFRCDWREFITILSGEVAVRRSSQWVGEAGGRLGMKKNITALAARNNALWCDAVCRAYGRPGEFHDTLWLTRLGAPRFYPDAVTLSGSESAPAQIEAIAALVGSTREREWAVKDSFQALELNSLGFEPLFEPNG